MSKKRPVKRANRNTPRQKQKTTKNLSKNISYQTQNSKITLSKDGFISEPNLFDKYIGNLGIVLALVLILIVGFTAYWDYLTLKYSYFFSDIGSDTLNTLLPSMNTSKNPQHGPYGIRSWNMYQGMGQNIGAGIRIDPIRSFFNWIYRKLYSIYGPDLRYAGVFIKAFYTHMLFTGILFYLYLRTFSFSKYISILGALLFVYFGYMTLGGTWGHTNFPFNAAFMLFAFEQLYQKNRWIFFPFAVLYFSHNAFIVYMYTAVFIGTYSILRFYVDYGLQIKKYLILFSKMFILGLFGYIFNLSVIISNYMKLFGAPRVSGNVSFMSSGGSSYIFKSDTFDVNKISEKFTLLFRLFSNDLLGNGSNYKGWYNYLEAPVFYCGLITILLVPVIFLYLKKRAKKAYGIYLLFWALVALIPQFRHAVQAFIGNYYKQAIDVFVPFVLIFFGLSSLSKLVENNSIVNTHFYIPLKNKKFFRFYLGNNPHILLIWIVNVISLIALYYPYKFSGVNPIDNELRNIIAIFLIGYSILLHLFISFKKYRLLFQIIILLTVCIELSYFTGVSVNRRAAYSVEEVKVNGGGFDDNTIEAVNYLRKIDKGFFRLEKEYSSGTAQHRSMNDGKFQGFYGTASYSSYNQKYYVKFLEGIGEIKLGVETQTRWAPGLKRRPLLETLASVKYYLSKYEEPVHQKNGLAFPIAKVKDITILKNRYALPFGFSYDKFILRSDYVRLNQLQKDIAMLRAFVVDDDYENFNILTRGIKQISLKDTIRGFTFMDYKKFTDQLRQDTLQIQKQSMSYFEGDIEVENSKVLFFSTPWDIGWRCQVNDKKVDVERVNIGLIGIPLSKGQHHVILEYIPPFYHSSILLSKLGYVLFGIVIIVKNRKKIKKDYLEKLLNRVLGFFKRKEN